MRFIVFILSFLLLASCQDVERPEPPADLISEDKMVNVLTELSLIHGARSYNKNMLEATGIKPHEYLWEKFDIDSLQFVRSNNYYAQNYKQYQKIYGAVKQRLENYKVLYDSLRELEEIRRDSLDTELEEERDTLNSDLERPPRDTLPREKFNLGREGQLNPLPERSEDTIQ